MMVTLFVCFCLWHFTEFFIFVFRRVKKRRENLLNVANTLLRKGVGFFLAFGYFQNYFTGFSKSYQPQL